MYFPPDEQEWEFAAFEMELPRPMDLSGCLLLLLQSFISLLLAHVCETSSIHLGPADVLSGLAHPCGDGSAGQTPHFAGGSAYVSDI